MKLAEALAERKALDARLSSIEGRLRANARIQEGDALAARIRGIDARIQAANWATELS